MRFVLTMAFYLIAQQALADTLRGPERFATIQPPEERAAAIFVEAAKVFASPRCLNCHPDSDRPGQTDAMRAHLPLVTRGEEGFGRPGMRCTSCHQKGNRESSGVPGAPHWHLAPASMTFVGRTPAQICSQITDPALNGDRSIGVIIMHVAFDPLIAWAWTPGGDRTPAPGDHQTFVALMSAWAEAGAACPDN